MKGGIYQRDGRYLVRFRGVYRRFASLGEAERFLNGLRYKTDEGTFDERDYRKDNPLGFTNLARKWLDLRKGQVRCLRNLRNHLDYADNYFGNQNIKNIDFGGLEDFLHALPETLTGKSKKNVFATVHAFFVWAKKRQYIPTLPEFPGVKFELGWRHTIDKDTQNQIIEEVRRIAPVKVWLGIKWLATYVSIRPGELIFIKEGDFDFQAGGVWVRRRKVGDPVFVPMLEEDLQIVQQFPRAFPELYFFRHERPWHRRSATLAERTRFGKDHLYYAWKQACSNLGIEGIDLYGGTRHSTVRALRDRFSPEQIKRATMHSTNAAFERYFQVELEDVRAVYRAAPLSPQLPGRQEEGK